jgi:ParB family chromosome partitioning protein
MTHDLKIWPEWFDLVVSRRKEFELRKDDRVYSAGDMLRLRVWDPKTEKFLGPVARCRVGVVMRNLPGLQAGFVAMSIVFIGMESRRETETHEH